jgi:hypothetical protein
MSFQWFLKSVTILPWVMYQDCTGPDGETTYEWRVERNLDTSESGQNTFHDHNYYKKILQLDTQSRYSFPLMEEGYNTSTVALRVIEAKKREPSAWRYNSAILSLGHTWTWSFRLWGKTDASQSRQTVKYGHESYWTCNQESLCWRGPAAI